MAGVDDLRERTAVTERRLREVERAVAACEVAVRRAEDELQEARAHLVIAKAEHRRAIYAEAEAGFGVSP